jgi:hypothetical protein
MNLIDLLVPFEMQTKCWVMEWGMRPIDSLAVAITKESLEFLELKK